MSIQDTRPHSAMAGPLGLLGSLHPASFAGLWLAGIDTRRAESHRRQAEERLARMPPHLRDDVGLPPLVSEEPEHEALATARRRAARRP